MSNWIRKNGKLLRKMSHQDWWLMDAIKLLRPWFRRVGYPLPRGILAVYDTCWNAGWHGESWAVDGVVVKHPRIIVSSVCLQDPVMVLKTLTHELCHTAVKNMGHEGPFADCAQKIGLLGVGGQWPLSDKLNNTFERICKKNGPFLTYEQTRKQKQKQR